MTNPSSNLVALDMGFLYNKALVNDRRIKFKSVVGYGRRLRFDDLMFQKSTTDEEEKEDRIIANVNGLEYFVSDLAIKQSDSIDYTLKADRFNTDIAKVMLHTVLAKGFGSGNFTTNVVSGLPVSHYTIFKDHLRELFKSTQYHQYDVNVERIQLKGIASVDDLRLIPQPFGAYCDLTLGADGKLIRKDLAVKTIAVVDVGMGTSDVYVVNALEPIEALTFSTPTAMNHAYTLISDKIEEMFNITLPLYKIEKIVRTGAFSIRGEEIDMEPVIKWSFQKTAKQLVAEIYNKWKNTWEIDEIVIAGGGGEMLSPFLLPEFENITLLENPQWSVVKGYNKWGRRTWKDGSGCQEEGIHLGQRVRQNG